MKRRLGLTDIELSPIGQGCWQFAQGKGFTGSVWATLDQNQIDAVVRASLEGGVTWFDTAEVYGGGQSERALSTALNHLGVTPGEVVIATKWLPIPRTAHNITRTIERRLSALQGYPIDLYQVHQPWSFSSIAAQMRAMARLVQEQKIRCVGVSNFSAEQMRTANAALAAEGIPLASNQVSISLLDRRIETNGVLQMAKRLGVSLIAYSPLAQGVLTGGRASSAVWAPLAPLASQPGSLCRSPGAFCTAHRRAACRRQGARCDGGAGGSRVAHRTLWRHGCGHPRRHQA
jgi:aryl-alcohol dehydrogenase-like predicted oxidoreductase